MSCRRSLNTPNIVTPPNGSSRAFSVLQTLQVGDEALVAAQDFVPRDEAPLVGSRPPQNCPEVAPHAFSDGSVGVIPLVNAVVERRDVANGPLLIDGRRLPAAIELLASDQHLPAILGFKDAL